MTTFRYWVGILVVVSVPPAVVWWFVIHPFVAFWRRVGVRLTLACVTLFYLAGVIGLYRWKSALLGADLGTSWLTVGAGLVLIIFAAAIAVRRKRELTWRILVGVPELEEGGGGRLLTTGLYARLRHPRYVEVFLGVWGYALVSNHVGVYMVAAITAPLLHLIVLLEERELLERFGEEYEAYRSRVPGYVPQRRAGAGLS